MSRFWRSFIGATAATAVGMGLVIGPATTTAALSLTSAESQTLLLVRARADRFPVPSGQRVRLVEGLRTDGALTGVRVWCEFRGARLAHDAQRRFCRFRVAGPTRTSTPDRVVHRRLRVAVVVTCSSPRLQVRVRIGADRSVADRSRFDRRWLVDGNTGGPCRLPGTG